MSAPDHPVILYDGNCGYCDRWVQWVLARDPAGHFRFAALDSPEATRLLGDAGPKARATDTIVLVHPGGRVYTESGAALRIPKALGLPWRLLGLGLLVPAVLRDGVYRRVAARRHRLAPPSGPLPTPGERARFLDRGVS